VPEITISRQLSDKGIPDVLNCGLSSSLFWWQTMIWEQAKAVDWEPTTDH
jgi:hypothetical protein